MEYLLGLLTAVVFFVAYELGKRSTKKTPIPTDDEEEWVRRQKKIQQDFTRMMNYDVEKALQRKKVQ